MLGRVVLRPVSFALAFLVTLVVATLAATYAAPSYGADVTTSGPGGKADFDRTTSAGLSGFTCSVGASLVLTYPESDPGSPVYSVRGGIGCATARLQGDVYLNRIEFRGDTCDFTTGSLDLNIDEAAEDSATFETSSSAGCSDGVTTACLIYGDSPIASGGTSFCRALILAAPDEIDPDAAEYNQGVSGCTSYTPLEPWVTDYEAVAVSGGWAWRSTLTINVSYTDPPAALGEYAPYPRLHASVSAAGAVEVLDPADGQWKAGSGPHGGDGWISEQYRVFHSGGFQAEQSRSIRFTGPTLVGAVGSVPPNWSWRGAGIYWGSGGMTANSNSHPESMVSRPTLASIAADTGEYGGHHDPERCHFWWGTDIFPTDTSGYDTPAGPLTYRSSPTPPPPPVVVPPPTVVVNPPGGVCPEETLCVNPPPPLPDGGAPSVPDPDSEGCDFSLTDPSSWGGQLICALTSLFGGLFDIVGDLLGAIANLVLDLIAGLTDLFLALFIPSEFPDFTGFDVDLPSGWIPTLPDFGDPGCGTISMPSVNLGPLLPETGPGNPIDTCAQPWPMVRSVTYYGVLAVGLISIANRMFRMVLDALGMGVDFAGSLPDVDRGGRK